MTTTTSKLPVDFWQWAADHQAALDAETADTLPTWLAVQELPITPIWN